MSGSLNILGSSGEWIARTASGCPLGVNQSAFSACGFIQVNSPMPTGSAVTVFGFQNNPLSVPFFVQVGGSPAMVSLNFKGGATFYNWPIVLGETIFWAATFTYPGTAYLYLNAAVVNSYSPTGNTLSNTNAIQIGWPGTLNGSILVSDFAWYNGTAETQANLLKLRDRTATPATLGWTSWWTLQGTAGANPTTADAGMLDSIGANNLATISNPTDATYSATALTYVPPITATSYVDRSGSIVYFFIGTNPVFGPVTPIYPTVFNGDPTFKLNGSSVSAQGRLCSDVSHLLPWVAYQLYTPGSPNTNIVLGPTDVVTWTTPDNWIGTSTQLCAASSGTCPNYVGQFEPGMYGYPGMNISDNQKNFLVGWNVSDISNELSLYRNCLHKTGPTWNNAATSTADGWPLTSTGSTVSATIWSSGDANGLSTGTPYSGFPCPIGQYTLYFDDTNPSSPCTASLTSSVSSGSITGPTVTGGTIVGGILTNQKYVWQVTGAASGDSYNLSLVLTFTLPSAPNVTAQNARLFFNVDDVTTANDLSPSTTVMGGSENNPVGMFLSGTSSYPAAVRQLNGPDGFAQLTVPSDLIPANQFSWIPQNPVPFSTWSTGNPTLAGPRILNIYSVQAYSLSVSPKIFLANKGTNATGGAIGTADSTYPLYPYSMQPAAIGLSYDWWFPAADWGPTQHCVVEFVVADSSGNPVAHNLQSGQQITLNASFPSFSVINSNGTATASLGGLQSIVFVTSSNKFMALCTVTGLTAAAAMATANGTQVLSGPNNTAQPQFTALAPVEANGAISAAAPSIGTWLVINHNMNDAAVLAKATRERAVIPVGTKVYLQCSNEIFFGNFQNEWLNGIAQLGGFGTNVAEFWMQRTSEIHAIFTTVWGSDAGSLVRLWQPASVNPNNTLVGLQYAQAHSIPIDMVVVDVYVSMDESQSFTMAAAAIYANDTDSIAYLGSAGSGPQNGSNPTFPASQPSGFAGQVMMPVDGYQSLFRHRIKYGKDQVAPNSLPYQHYQEIVASQYGTGAGPSGFKYAMPKMGLYEFAVSTGVPPAVSLNNHNIRSQITYDLMQHPSMRDTIDANFIWAQQWGSTGSPGFAIGCLVGLQNLRTAGDVGYNCSDGHADNAFCEMWATYEWQNQQRGYGTTNQYYGNIYPNVTGTGRYNPNNQSVVAQTVADWIGVQTIFQDFADARQGTVLNPDSDPLGVDPRQGSVRTT